MEPFVHIKGYSITICKSCRFACVAGEVISHLGVWHASIKAKERRDIAAKVSPIPVIIQDQAGLSEFEFPPPATDPIPFIAPPEDDGLRCSDEGCRYVTRTEYGILAHCRKEHGWVSKRREGVGAEQRARQARKQPWTKGVRCQRFFKSHAASGWFEVGRVGEGPVAHPRATEVMVERIKQIHASQVERFETRREDVIQVADDKSECNGWLSHVGWAQHLKGLDPAELRRTRDPIEEDKVVLQGMWEILERVMDKACATAVSTQVGSPALFEIQRKEIRIKPGRPFDNRMEEDSWARYKEVRRRLLCILHRTQMGERAARSPYRFTKQQDKGYSRFVDTVAAVAGDARQMSAAEERIDRLALELAMSLLDHQFK